MMTTQELISAALRRINVIDAGAAEVNAALLTLNGILSNFEFWQTAADFEMQLDEDCPLPAHYVTAVITKLSLKEGITYNIPTATMQMLAAEDADNMAKLFYRNAINKGSKASTLTII